MNSAATKNAVWIISQFAGSPHHGMRFRDYYLAREMVKRGYRPYIIAASCCHLRSRQPTVSGDFTFETIDGIAYIWVRVPAYRKSRSLGRALAMLCFGLQLARLPHRRLDPPCAVIVNSLSPFPMPAARRWARAYGSRLLFEVVDIWPITIVQIGKVSRLHPFVVFMQLFENYAYRHADFVVSLLPCAKGYMMRHGMQPDKFVYIPNGADETLLSQQVSPGPEVTARVPRDAFVVGYTGKLGLANALEHFLFAANILRDRTDICFVVLGQGDERGRLVALQRRLQLDHVVFLDAVPKDQVQAVLQLFDVCYLGLAKLPLFAFGVSPTKLFEYMLAGKPVLQAIDAGNDVVSDAGCGLTVAAEDADAIAHGVLHLYAKSPAERERLGQNGKRYVLSHHTYDKLAEGYIRLFETR